MFLLTCCRLNAALEIRIDENFARHRQLSGRSAANHLHASRCAGQSDRNAAHLHWLADHERLLLCVRRRHQANASAAARLRSDAVRQSSAIGRLLLLRHIRTSAVAAAAGHLMMLVMMLLRWHRHRALRIVTLRIRRPIRAHIRSHHVRRSDASTAAVAEGREIRRRRLLLLLLV